MKDKARIERAVSWTGEGLLREFSRDVPWGWRRRAGTDLDSTR